MYSSVVNEDDVRNDDDVLDDDDDGDINILARRS